MRTVVAFLLILCTDVYGQTNPALRPPRDITALSGWWYGAHLERRSSCEGDPNNGLHATYSVYLFSFDPPTHSMSITENAVNGLTCNWQGTYRDDGGATALSGTLTCSDGRSGTFTAPGPFVISTLMSLRVAVKLSGTESCSIDAIVSGARFEN